MGQPVGAAIDLLSLCEKWHTPKGPISGNPNAHHYTETYEKLLAGRKVRKMLEIGCGYRGLFHPDYVAGGSLFMWAEYFPGSTEIYGIDNREDALVNVGNIKSFLCDQSDMRQLVNTANAIGPNIDFIIDDGSHHPSDQNLTMEIFLPYLAKGGLYVVEDVAYPNQIFDFGGEFLEFDLQNVPDDRLYMIER